MKSKNAQNVTAEIISTVSSNREYLTNNIIYRDKKPPGREYRLYIGSTETEWKQITITTNLKQLPDTSINLFELNPQNTTTPKTI